MFPTAREQLSFNGPKKIISLTGPGNDPGKHINDQSGKS